MPLYEYLCENGHKFEVIRKFSDPPLETCPTCGSPVQKQMSSPAIQFKGTGWYVTDYARKGSGESKETKGSKESKDAGDKKDSEQKDSGGSKETTTEKSSSDSSSSTTTTSTSPPTTPSTAKD